MKELQDKTIAFLVADGYEDLECWYPKIRLEEEGAETVVASYEEGTYNSKHGYPIEATKSAEELNPNRYDGVVIPGGTSSPDKLRRYSDVNNFVEAMDDSEKLVAVICHAGWVAISARIVKNRTMTSYKAIKNDVKNAGAEYKDQSLVSDSNLVSSRHPGDLPDFCRGIIDFIA